MSPEQPKVKANTPVSGRDHGWFAWSSRIRGENGEQVCGAVGQQVDRLLPVLLRRLDQGLLPQEVVRQPVAFLEQRIDCGHHSIRPVVLGLHRPPVLAERRRVG